MQPIGRETLDTARFDLLVAGSGAAGLSAALTAAAEGLNVLVIEKSAYWGGSSALSAGGVWIPGNASMPQMPGKARDPDARLYLAAATRDTGQAFWQERQQSFLHAGPAMVDFMREKGVGLQAALHECDYRMDLPGATYGRMLEGAPFDTHRLGKWEVSQRPSGNAIPFTTSDIAAATRGFKDLGSLRAGARVGGRAIKAKLLGRNVVGGGAALIASLFSRVIAAKVTVWLDTPLIDLVMSDDQVVGAVIDHAGERVEVLLTYGVILASGGFAHGPMRADFQKRDGAWSVASRDDTGDFLTLSQRYGLKTESMDAAWWIPTMVLPQEGAFCVVGERARPGSIIVDDHGKRFANEAQNYNEFGLAMRRHAVDEAWLIIDWAHRARYMFGPVPPGKLPQELLDSGFFRCADSIAELARLCDIDPANLSQTIELFNEQAAAGKDGDFARGDTIYEQYWGDPKNKPNPCLRPLTKPPYLATRIYLGDLGTRGGLVTDDQARVIGTDGTPIAGLYAAGNATTSVMGPEGYPGPGSTLGPAMTFGYIAARHAAGLPGR